MVKTYKLDESNPGQNTRSCLEGDAEWLLQLVWPCAARPSKRMSNSIGPSVATVGTAASIRQIDQVADRERKLTVCATAEDPRLGPWGLMAEAIHPRAAQ